MQQSNVCMLDDCTFTTLSITGQDTLSITGQDTLFITGQDTLFITGQDTPYHHHPI
jgi:hypothetical protein